jgi:hypothetical protein
MTDEVKTIKMKKSELKALKDRVLTDTKGKRYILLSDKKRVKVKDNISERQLLIWLIKHLKPRRKRKAIGDQSRGKIDYPNTNLIDRSYSQSIQNFDALQKLKNDIQTKEKEKEVKVPQLPIVQIPALPAAIQPALPPVKNSKDEVEQEEHANFEHEGKIYRLPVALLKEQRKRDNQLQKEKLDREVEIAKNAEALKEIENVKNLHEKSERELKIEKANNELKVLDEQIQKQSLAINGYAEQKFNRAVANIIDKNINDLKRDAVKAGLKLKNPNKEALQQALLEEAKIPSLEQFLAQEWTDVRKKKRAEYETRKAELQGIIGQGLDTKDGLTELEINNIMKRYPEYLGTIAADEVGSLNIPPKSRFGFIMNTDKRSQQGTHWVACFGDARPNGSNSLEYYNSFGEPPTKEFMKQIKGVAQKMDAGTYLKFKENKIVDQSANSSNCGYFAARFLIDRFRGKPFSECSGYDDHVKQEKDIEKFKSHLDIKPFRYIDSFKGEGFVDSIRDIRDRIKGFFTGRTKPPPIVRSLLRAVGEEEILSLKVGRSPVNSVITGILNAVSLGQLEQNRKDLNYDQIYHLALIVQTKSKSFTLERNQTVSVGAVRNFEEIRDVPATGGTIRFGTFLENGEKISKENFWRYNPVSNNCQIFVTDLLKGNGLLTTELNSFINQDAAGLLKHSPLAEKIASGITDFGHRIDILLHGAGKIKLVGAIPDLN